MRGFLVLLFLLAINGSAATAQWQVVVKKDEITDERTAVFRISAIKPTANAVRLPEHATLIFRCTGGKVSDAYVVVNAYMEDESTVQLRYDTWAPTEEVWSASSDNTGLFAPDAEQFIENLLGRRKLVFRYFPYQASPQTSVFAIPSLSLHRQYVLKYCGFDPILRLAEVTRHRQTVRRALDSLARERKADSLAEVRQRQVDSLNAVGEIELTPPDQTIEISSEDKIVVRSLVGRVTTNGGEVLSDFSVSYQIVYPDQGRSLADAQDTLPLEKGTNVVRVYVNHVQAGRELRYVVK